MSNPLIFSAGTTTVNSSHALRVTKMTVIAQSATAVSAQIQDLNGNAIGVPVLVPNTANAEVTADYGSVRLIIPGGTNLTSTNAVVTVTGAGGVCYLYHQ